MATTNGTNGTASSGLTLSFIGCGNMGSAILAGVLESCKKTQDAGEKPRISRFIATCASKGSAHRLKTRFEKYADNFEVMRGGNVKAMKEADVVLLAFKPYMLDLLKESGVRDALSGKLVISVLVGSPVQKIEAAIYHDIPSPPNNSDAFYISRVMPNVGAAIGESMSVIEDVPIPQTHKDTTNWVFSQVGKTQSVAPELFDIGGVLSGASGAMFSVAFDGMLDGAVSQGLKRADAKNILAQSVIAMAKLIEGGEHPAVMREMVSSPKGTTIAGLVSLEEDRARHAYIKAIISSSKRSQEIGKAV